MGTNTNRYYCGVSRTNGEGILILKSISLKLIVICSHIQRVTVKNYIGELQTRVKIHLELHTTSALGSDLGAW